MRLLIAPAAAGLRAAVAASLLLASLTSLAPRAFADTRPALADSTETAGTGTIHGRILAGDTPQPYANVFVLGIRRGTASDSTGQFRITLVPAGARQLRVQALGFEPVTIPLFVRAGDDTEITVKVAELPMYRARRHPEPDCGAGGADAGGGAAAVAPDTAGWWSAIGSIFEFALPPEFRRKRVQGIDSEVGEWDADSSRITYDLGMYTACAQAGNREAGVREECLHGYRAWIREHPDGDLHHVEACFPAFGLGLYGWSPDAGEAARILAAFRTIRFRDRDAPRVLTGPPAPFLPLAPRAGR